MKAKIRMSMSFMVGRRGRQQVRTGDQRVGSPGAALIIPQHLAFHSVVSAAGTVQPGVAPRSRSSRTCPSACEPGCHADGPYNCRRILPSECRPPAIARARQSRIKLAANISRSVREPARGSCLHRTNQSSKRWELVSIAECEFRLAGNILHGVKPSGRRFNAGDRVDNHETTPTSIPTNPATD
jgi:hypothetical protein